jgi:FMN phosphatase YigB (HAD superfamily)
MNYVTNQKSGGTQLSRKKTSRKKLVTSNASASGTSVPERSPGAKNSLMLWEQDPMLAPLGKALHTHKDNVLSVDFFDTLVFRLCNHPTDVFTALGERLRDNGLLRYAISPQEFREIRIAAERKARQVSFWENGTTEVCLAQIYQEMSDNIVTNVDVAMEMELNTEIEFCVRNPFVESLVHYANARGHAVYILSDMYLGNSQLRSIARHNGMDDTLFADILVSSEQKETKSSGELFRQLLKQTGVEPQHHLHVGDNAASDVAGATLVGVKAFHYAYGDDTARFMFSAEAHLNSELSSNVPLATNAIRSLARRVQTKKENEYSDAGLMVLGPVLANYADWCIRQAQRMGIRKVFTFMREGRLLGKMLKNSAEAQDVDMQISELFVSRHSTHLASVGEPTRTVISERIYSRTVGEVLDSFGLSATKIGFPTHLTEKSIDNPELLHTIIRFLTNGKLRDAVQKKSEIARRQFLGYMLPMLNTEKVAFADLGWGCTIQRNIERIFEIEKIPLDCHGLYLATSGVAATHALKGIRFSSYVCQQHNYQRFARTLIRSPEMIEQAVCAPIGTTIGYIENTDQNVEPLLDQVRICREEIQHRNEVQQAILAYQQRWLEIATDKGIFHSTPNHSESLYDRGAESLMTQSRFILERLISFPTRAEASSLGRLHHDEGAYSQRSTIIADPMNVAVFENDGYHAMTQVSRNYWPQGVLALSDDRTFQRWVPQVAMDFDSDENDRQTPEKSPFMKHPLLPFDHIKDILFEAGVCVVYTIQIRCPHCQEIFEEQLLGSYTIQKTLCCPHCRSLWTLNFDVMHQWLTRYRPEVAGANSAQLNWAVSTIRKRVSDSFSTPDSVPLLATLANRSTVYHLNQIVCAAMNEKDIRK